MPRPVSIISLLLGIGLAATAGSNPPEQQPAVRLLLNETEAGSLQSQQYCGLIFANHRFHYEKAGRHHGRDIDRKVYEGELNDAEWNSLTGALDSQAFRDVKVPEGVPPLVMQDAHDYTISVLREDGNFQNMEFLNDKGRKPYEAQLKPLLEWWRTFRGRRMPETKVQADQRCIPASGQAVFSQ